MRPNLAHSLALIAATAGHGQGVGVLPDPEPRHVADDRPRAPRYRRAENTDPLAPRLRTPDAFARRVQEANRRSRSVRTGGRP